MAHPAPTATHVPAETYRCTNCGQEIALQPEVSLPPCPSCNGTVATVCGGDSASDRYPD